MTDATPTPPTPDPVTPPAAPAAPAYTSSPAVAGPKQTTSLVGFILGIAAFVFSWTGILGIGLGIAALIVRSRGKKTEPGAPTWMPIVAMIGGILGIVIGVIVGISWISLFALAAISGASYNY